MALHAYTPPLHAVKTGQPRVGMYRLSALRPECPTLMPGGRLAKKVTANIRPFRRMRKLFNIHY